MNGTCRIEKKSAHTFTPAAADLPIRTGDVWAFAGAWKALRLTISDGTKPELANYRQVLISTTIDKVRIIRYDKGQHP